MTTNHITKVAVIKNGAIVDQIEVRTYNTWRRLFQDIQNTLLNEGVELR